MRNSRLEQNLNRITNELAQHEPGHNGDPTEAQKIAWSVPLTHSTSTQKLRAIVVSGRLLSLKRLMESRGTTSDPDNLTTEEILGTDDCVFLFAGPFRYTNSSCGFIFRAELESVWPGTGEASPFDTGGLLGTFTGFAGEARDFLDRFRLPLYAHREYLARKLRLFFPELRAYVEPTTLTDVHDPITGLTGGDARRWTHEVRLKDEVNIRSHLEAVFYRKSRGFHTGVRHFLMDCQNQGIYTEFFEAPRNLEFDVMLNCCCDYIERNIGL